MNMITLSKTNITLIIQIVNRLSCVEIKDILGKLYLDEHCNCNTDKTHDGFVSSEFISIAVNQIKLECSLSEYPG